jgi:hypothetical protein
MKLRPILALSVATAGVALFLADGSATSVASSTASSLAGARPNGSGSVWYCPAAFAVEADSSHVAIVFNPSSREASARVTAFGVTADAAASTTVKVAPKSREVVDLSALGAGLGGASVEVTGPGVTVTHRVGSSNTTDESECTTSTGRRWDFAVGDTVQGATSRLWLLNPFPTPATVDVRTSAGEGDSVLVRTPAATRGIVLPGKSAVSVDLGVEALQLREQFALSVVARSGQIVAELAQARASGGLRLEMGVDRLRSEWVFADGFGGDGVSDRVVVFNPSARARKANLWVFPEGLSAEEMPEPLSAVVQPRGYWVVQLDKEERIPQTGLRWVRVTADGAVMATHVVGLNGEGGDGTSATRPTVASGAGSTSGAPIAARRWLVNSVLRAGEGQAVVRVANPSTDSIAVVRLRVVTGGKSAEFGPEIEVQPGNSLAIDVSAAATDGDVSLEVNSTSPVLVASRMASAAREDFSLVDAMPDLDTVVELNAATGGG